MPAPHHFSTDHVAPRERAPLWCEWIGRHFGGLQTDLYGDTDFDGHLRAAQAGEVVLTRLEADRHRVLRSDDQARRSEAGYLKIIAPWQGRAQVEQDGRSACVQEGGWAIYDTTRHYAVANPDRSDHLIVMLPLHRFAGSAAQTGAALARHVGGTAGISRVALQAMRSTYQELPHMGAQAAHGAGELILQLVQLSLQEAAGRPGPEARRAALQDRIRLLVGQQLRDPALSIERIAGALQCSKRQLHHAFSAGDDGTLAGYIVRQRIEACMRDLRSSAHAHRTATEIALGWGFNSSAHFSRAFRQHTGEAPSAFRQGRPGG